MLVAVLILASVVLFARCGGGGGGDGQAEKNSKWGALVWGADRWQDAP
jgi:hypothetical protein